MGGAILQVDIGHGRGWLEAEAAKSQARIDKALGHPQQITEAGRDYAVQDAHYQRYVAYLNGGPWAPIALAPWTPSVHQKGRAKDTDERNVALMNDHGWFQTVFRWVKGVWTLVEPWHFEYDPARDNHRHEVVELVNDNGTWRIAPEKEWDEMATEAQIRAIIADEVHRALVVSKENTEKTVVRRGRVGAYKIVAVKGPATSPGPHMYLTGPGGRVHIANKIDLYLLRRYIQAPPFVSDDPLKVDAKTVTNGEETFTQAQFDIIAGYLARLSSPAPAVLTAAAKTAAVELASVIPLEA